MAWEVKYFVTADGVAPAQVFEATLPAALAQKLARITVEVALSDGTLGGGYFEPCHTHSNLFEIRAKRGKDLARYICARDGAVLVLLTGVLKGIEDATPEHVFAEANLLLAEYSQTKSTI